MIVDWAIELLEEGFESDSIKIIAGFEKPVNFFELNPFFKNVLQELNLHRFSTEQKILSYCTFHLLEIINYRSIKENLKRIYKLCQKMDFEEKLYDFYLLHWAWDDLDHQNYNHYWPDANRENIENLVVDKSKIWLKQNAFLEASQEKYFL